MNSPRMRVRFTLRNISLQATNNGSMVPVPATSWYMWTVFFKIDGDSVSLDGNLNIHGTATVVPTPGDHGDLPPNGNSRPVVDIVAVPAAIGDFRTVLAPIPITTNAGLTADGVVGCVAVLMRQDATGADAVAAGHNALNSSLQQQLNELIPKLPASDGMVTAQEVQVIENQVSSAVTGAVENALSIWDKLATFLQVEGQDSQIGTAIYYVTASQLASSAAAGISVTNGYPNPISIVIPMFQWEDVPGHDTNLINLQFSGIVTGDPLPLSLARILTRAGTNRVLAAMSKLPPPKSGGSVTAWVDGIS